LPWPIKSAIMHANIPWDEVKGEPMLIEEYELRRIPGGCDDDAQTISLQATVPQDVSAVYPYLNALLPGCSYNHAGKVIHWQEGPHKIVLRPQELAVSGLPSWTAAKSTMARLVDYLNQTWASREEIAPRREPHPQPTPLIVYKLLPGTNCRACGQPSCYAFALQLMARSATGDACPPLLQPEGEGQLAELQAMLVSPPPVLFPPA
jgi:ArsR family metal-binding transcriptional regulator